MSMHKKMALFASFIIGTATFAVAAAPCNATTHRNYQVRMVTRAMPQQMQLSELGRRDAQIRAQIAYELQAGQLTAPQSTALITMLDKVKETAQGYVGDGELSPADANALSAAMNSITAQIAASTNNPITRLNPASMGFALPNMGYTHGLNLPQEQTRQIGSVQPWWMY